MCDYNGKLTVWLDHELVKDEAAELELHLGSCAECRNRLRAYEQTSRLVDEYCDAVLASKSETVIPRWIPALSAAAVVALAVLLAFPRTHLRQPPAHTLEATSAQVAGVGEQLKAAKTPSIEHRAPRAIRPAKNQGASWASPQPAIRISIPADAMFPPGAVPEGVTFVADLSLAADGSVQQLQLRP